MSNKQIYLIYFAVLLSAIGFRTVRAYVPKKDENLRSRLKTENLCRLGDDTRIIGIFTEKIDKGGRVVIRLNNFAKPASEFYPEDNSLVLDFYDVLKSEEAAEVFVGPGLKLGYMVSFSDKTRVKIFAEGGSRLSLSYSGMSALVTIKDMDLEEKNKVLAEKNILDTDIDFSGESFDSVIYALASKAGIQIKLDKDLPETLTASFSSVSPFDALKRIAEENSLNFYKSGNFWYMSGRTL